MGPGLASPARRRALRAGGALLASLALPSCGGGGGSDAPATPINDTPPPPLSDAALVDETERRTFQYFWQTTDARGLAPDLYPGPAPASIAAMGFAFTALPIGVARGWVARAEAAQKGLAWLQFLRDAPQGTAATGCSGYRGYFYHFLDSQSGTRFGDSELSTIDTALLMMGVRCLWQAFDAAEATACLQAMYQRYGAVLWGEHGFQDCFNPSFRFDGVALGAGRRVGTLGWCDTRWYGINQGPLLALIENSRTGMLWNLSHTDPVLVRGLQRAGFSGGWLG